MLYWFQAGGGHCNPLQYCLKNPKDRGAWQATVHRVAQSWTWLKWYGMHTCLGQVYSKVTDIYTLLLLLLLLLLSRFSRVWLCATPEKAAHQAPPSLGFSRQEHWSGLPFPSPMHKVKSESEVAQSCPTLSNPMECSLPGSSIHGIFQARVLEWGTIAFSNTHYYVQNR